MSAGSGIGYRAGQRFQEHRWTEACQTFREADRRGGLPAADLEQLATAEILTGDSTTGLETLTRAHEEYLVMGDVESAARCAGWMGMQLMFMGGSPGPAGGLPAPSGLWTNRRGRALCRACCSSRWAWKNFMAATRPARWRPSPPLPAGQRFHDRDLSALGLLGTGQATLMLGHPEQGLNMFDEVMVAVTAGELSPIPSGIIYCAVIGTCHLALDLERALAWTAALDRCALNGLTW